ncbi:MAG TPA: hypothetical protein VE961_20015 [Pyrinomonadaceae bacterium]|nr:hypothetical protein [Pyrinomonadaceae bacterium]
MDEKDNSELWYHPHLDVFLNRWYADYDAARASLERDGGFLLPYRRHFFVCQPEVISALGVDPDDPDWQAIGRDCARPRDAAAFERLRQKREKVVRQAA